MTLSANTATDLEAHKHCSTQRQRFLPIEFCREGRERFGPCRLSHYDLNMLGRLAGSEDRVSEQALKMIYWPLAQHVLASYDQWRTQQSANAVFCIGISGSVAVGKSSGARILTEMLRRYKSNVNLVTTDHFLKPTAVLEQEDCLHRKGFPESFDEPVIQQFIEDLNGDTELITIPTYDHVAYTRIENKLQTIVRPEIMVLEGVNVLQRTDLPRQLGIYFHAPVQAIERWYIRRFLQFRRQSFRQPHAYFNRYAHFSDEAAQAVAHKLWRDINLPNLQEFIAPSRHHAACIINKDFDHAIESVDMCWSSTHVTTTDL